MPRAVGLRSGTRDANRVGGPLPMFGRTPTPTPLLLPLPLPLAVENESVADRVRPAVGDTARLRNGSDVN